MNGICHIDASSNTYLSICHLRYQDSLFNELAVCAVLQMKARRLMITFRDDVEQPAMWHQ